MVAESAAVGKCCGEEVLPFNVVAATGGRGGFRHHPIGAAPVSATEGRCGKHRQRLVYPPSFWRARRRRAVSATEDRRGMLTVYYSPFSTAAR
jgi:hypothetical protein